MAEPAADAPLTLYEWAGGQEAIVALIDIRP